MTALSFKSRFVTPIRVGLRMAVPAPAYVAFKKAGLRPKRHSIRSGHVDRGGQCARSPKGQLRAEVGREIALYCGMRTKRCFLIGRARCTKISQIILHIDSFGLSAIVGGKALGTRRLEELARSDGFTSVGEMAEFWRKENNALGKWEGIIIEWEPLDGREENDVAGDD